MALSIYTNVASLNAQRNLYTNSLDLNRSLQRLSSGLRINSASDDAAGLAISTGLTAQFRGLNQAVRNASDGLSLFGTAESAINEQVNLLQRIRELAVQSASDTNSGSNRASLNDEVAQLKAEFDRIGKTVQFNGLNLLDGTFSNKDIQVGAYSGGDQRISISMAASLGASLGQSYTKAASGAVTGAALTDGAFKITSGGVETAIGASANGSAKAIAAAINLKTQETGVTATAAAISVQGSAQTAGSAGSTTYSDTTPWGILDTATYNSGTMHIAIDPAGANHDVSVGAVTDGDPNDGGISAMELAAAINAALTADGSSDLVATAVPPSVARWYNVDESLNGDTLQINGQNVDLTGVSTRAQLADAITNTVASSGVSAAIDSDGHVRMTAVDGRNLNIVVAHGSAAGNIDHYFNTGVWSGQMTISGSSDFLVADASAFHRLDGMTGTPSVSSGTDSIADGDLKINGVSIGATTLDAIGGTNIVDAINAIHDQSGVTAALDAGTHKITLTSADGEDIKVELANNAASLSGLTAGATHSTLSLTSGAGAFTVTDGDGATGLGGAATKGTDSLAQISVSNKAGALATIETIDRTLAALNGQRAAIGAQTNRLNSVIRNLSAVAENVAASSSRILDADFAGETATLTRAQILQQAAVSVLAQANQAPQLALKLLQ